MRSHTAAVVEMGMSAPGEIDLLARLVGPDVGVITNIGPAHLEFLGSMDAVARGKGRTARPPEIRRDCRAECRRPVLRDAEEEVQRPRSFLRHRHAGDVRASDIRQEKDFTDFTLAADGSTVDVRLRAVGRHNIYNALAAAAAAIAVGMSLDAVKYGLDDFVPAAMRSELKAVKGRTVLADYYNANPGSMEAALETLVSLQPGRTGRLPCSATCSSWERSAVRRTARSARPRPGSAWTWLITVGPLAKHIAEGRDRCRACRRTGCFEAGSHAEAAALLKQHPGTAMPCSSRARAA